MDELVRILSPTKLSLDLGLGPGTGVFGKEGSVAVDRDDTEQMPARSAQSAAVQPTRHFGRPQSYQPGDLGRNIVRLDVEVVARLVINRLNRRHEPGQSVFQNGELRLTRRAIHRHSQRCRPERRRLRCMLVRRVYENGGDAAAMHDDES